MIVITGSDGQVGIELQKQLKKNRINYLALNKKKLNITSSKSIKNNFDDIKSKLKDKVFKYNDKCYQYKEKITTCNKNKKIVEFA